MDPQQVKITVLKTTFNKDFVEQYAQDYKGQPWRACSLVHEGQEFVTTGWMPDGFCSHAWADILRYVMVLSRGGEFVGTAPRTFITCCTDGYRPVFFKVERMEQA